MIRTLTVILVILLTFDAQAQDKRKPTFNSPTKTKKQDQFLQKQWWIGLKGGINLTQALPEQQYTVIVGGGKYPVAQLEKSYGSFNKVGSQATVEVTFYYKGFSFSFQPTYRHSVFTYSNQFEWYDNTTPNNRLALTFMQENKVDYVDLPLIVKYDLTRTKLRPYVQAGVSYSLMVNATKSVTAQGTDFASGGTNQFTTEPLIVGATDLFNKSYWALLAGGGVDYSLGNVRLILDIQYRLGMSNVTHTTHRYNNDRLAGIGDAMDDMKLNNIIISAGCLFPLRFLGTGFKTLDR